MLRKWRSARRRVSEEASLSRLDGTRICDALVRDISTTGACVRLPILEPIASNLILTCAGLRLRAECEIVWRSKYDIGLRILRYDRQLVLPAAVAEA